MRERKIMLMLEYESYITSAKLCLVLSVFENMRSDLGTC